MVSTDHKGFFRSPLYTDNLTRVDLLRTDPSIHPDRRFGDPLDRYVPGILLRRSPHNHAGRLGRAEPFYDSSGFMGHHPAPPFGE